MAIGTPTSITATPLSSSTTTNSYTVTTTATVPGSSRIMFCAAFFSATTPTVTVSGGSLTWVPITPITQGSSYTLGVWTADAPAGLTSGTVLTIGTVVNAAGMMAAAFHCTGLQTGTTPGDGTKGTTSAVAGGTWTSGAMATTTSADDLLVGIGFGDGDNAQTCTATGTLNVELFDFNNVTTQWSLEVTYKVVAATGAYTASGTWLHSNSFGNAGHLTAIKADTGGAAATVRKNRLPLAAVFRSVR